MGINSLAAVHTSQVRVLDVVHILPVCRYRCNTGVIQVMYSVQCTVYSVHKYTQFALLCFYTTMIALLYTIISTLD